MLLRQICTDCVFGRESALPPLFFLFFFLCVVLSFVLSYLCSFPTLANERTERLARDRVSRASASNQCRQRRRRRVTSSPTLLPRGAWQCSTRTVKALRETPTSRRHLTRERGEGVNVLTSSSHCTIRRRGAINASTLSGKIVTTLTCCCSPCVVLPL